ncbi:MAG: GNAT family N-acetyltransferase [Desulfomonilia bacterium]|jgi:putative acetyltransferase|uniref:Putative enzyme n=1 Tax=anaerobic digester metagenome TaxID=1263854 RepID=A0A485LYS3_9ZZZZ|nr:GNAT family N-acetyltransferase [Pseudomonadota bacterium]HON37214.1 GNAT family N-acetyltransferase [Deltaproteobacteria bacterium]HRS57107.1 GNAT family N-acetyltransferase [Desulfomonilia bacterium]HPD20028.1 GNAT family N-acetyltransferase [Deltaproteobacteria bacterium]HPX18588.1 GNAT family N-acetyltransferase [Deltaproteobacteria bacterium]
MTNNRKNCTIEIRRCSTDSDFSSAIRITKDYVHWLGLDLSFQDIDREYQNFPAMYGPPDGLFLLALRDGVPAGGAGLRLLEARICEMKRLFVYDRFKNQGIGSSLCRALIREAQALGYEKMRLDTMSYMQAAIRLYESLGFREIAPYRFNPDPAAKYLELDLAHHA